MLLNLVSIRNTVSRRHNLQNRPNALQTSPLQWTPGDIAVKRFQCAAHENALLPIPPMVTVFGGFCDGFMNS